MENTFSKWNLRRLLTLTSLTVVMTMLTMPQPGNCEAEEAGIRYVFPFYPKELDILIGHLQTKIYRLKETLKTCEEIVDGNHDAGDYVINVFDKGDVDDVPSGRVGKLEKIADLRDKIDSLEERVDKCRFKFWTGDVAQ